MSAAARASRNTPTAQKVTRRRPDFVRPYLTKGEAAALVEFLTTTEDTGQLLDPSLSTAIAELRRWL